MTGPEHAFEARLGWTFADEGPFAEVVLHPTVTIAPGSDENAALPVRNEATIVVL